MARRPLTRLAQIYQQEKASGGGAFSTIGKRSLEKIDPRQMFNQSGFLAMLLPSLFKAYKAAPTSSAEVERSKTIRSIHSQMNVIRIDNKIIARNTMVIPAMARDINVIRKNIVATFKKLGLPFNAAPDSYFLNAGLREKEYEKKYSDIVKAETPKSKTTPTPVGEEDENKGWLGKILKTLAIGLTGFALTGLFSTDVFGAASDWVNNPDNQSKIGNFFSWILESIKSGLAVLGDLGSALMNEYSREDSEFRKTINGIIDSLLNFITEHPFVALGAAFVTFGDLLTPLVIALGLVNGVIPGAIAALGAFWAGLELAGKIKDWGKEGKKELRAQHEARLAEIHNISDPKLREGIIKQIKLESENSSFDQDVVVWSVYNKYKDKIEEDKKNKEALEAQGKAESKPNLVTGVDTPGTIPPPAQITPPAVPSTPTTSVPPPPAPRLTPTVSAAVSTTPTVVPSATPTTPVTAPTKLSGTSNVDKVMNYLMSAEGLGLSREQSAGIVGNLQKESYADIRPDAENPSGHYGIAQWSPERQKVFENVMGKPMRGSSLEDQLAFMKYEMTKGEYKGALTKLKSATGYEQATEAFHSEFEKSEQKNISDRIAFAKGATQGPTTPTAISSQKTETPGITPTPVSTELNWKPGVNQNINADVKNKLQELQSIYGDRMTITSGGEKSGHVSNSQHYQGKAVDIRFKGTDEERADFIRKASALGFTGIGAYKSGLIHLDTRAEKMTWGDTYKRGSEPEWAKTALAEHMSGKITPVSPSEQTLLSGISGPEAISKPIFDGKQINAVSTELSAAWRDIKPPTVNVVNPPAPPQAQNYPATDAKPQYNDGVIDREFVRMLVGRTVDNFTVAA